jgi:hypothetical protein
MKFILVVIGGLLFTHAVPYQSPANTRNLKVIIIRHAEKPPKGDNLTCEGLNRSLRLPAILNTKFGIPDYVYVPSLGMDKTTKHCFKR